MTARTYLLPAWRTLRTAALFLLYTAAGAALGLLFALLAFQSIILAATAAHGGN